ncbi:MAG: transketolase [Schwartzia sp.]|nr:transketolase [Schwartzia sp. (in: firmicutes)]
MTETDISAIALKIRQRVLKMAMGANGGHIAPAYSLTDIVAELYFDGILRYDAKKPDWPERDYFVLSKGHGVLALYVALSMAGYFPEEELYTFCKPGSHLGSLAKKGSAPGIEASTGSLGHGLSYAVGIALACKLDHLLNKIFVLVGDGECEEGSIWEALMAAAHHKLDNLTVIVDYNGLQAMDSLKNIMSLDGFKAKLTAFGFTTEDIDGHDYAAIKQSLTRETTGRPRAVIAHTIKGKGISFMENVPIWHYRIPNEEELAIALRELKMTREDLGSYEKCLFRNII